MHYLIKHDGSCAYIYMYANARSVEFRRQGHLPHYAW